MSEFVKEIPVKAQSLPADSEGSIDFTDLPAPKAASLRSTYYGPSLAIKPEETKQGEGTSLYKNIANNRPKSPSSYGESENSTL
jgi:hypothetical protein